MSLLGNEEKQLDLVLRLRVDRPLYNQDTLNQEFYYEKPKISLINKVSDSLANKNCKSCITSMLPVTKWIRKYKLNQYIISDVIAGITVAIMHIPHGMAYASLGNVPPVVGMYMAFFPVLVYFLLGTSKHVSMGTFAIVCLMTGKTVTSYAHLSDNLDLNATNVINGNISTEYTPIQVATAVTFTVGIFQLIMFFLRLGIISTLLSETLVNGFTTGAAIHVLMSQIKDLIGLKLSKRKIDHFKLIYTTIDIFTALNDPNFAAVIVSAVTIIIMILNNELFKPWLKKKCNMPLPMELIAVITGTLISNYCDLQGKYKIQTIGDIPTGLPKPELPTFQLLSIVAVDCIAITMVSYTITLSMALIFAQKLQYEIDSNQELFAMGMGNVVGSFFSCMPVSASLSRSLIQQTVGGKTQIASIISCSVLLIILLWIGPFFETLPKCVLASIIIVALKGMLLQAKQLPRFWRFSKLDGITWIITFLGVILVGIDIGLLLGLLTSLVSILLLSIKSYSCLLGHVPNTDLYLDICRYGGTVEMNGIKIFHYCGGLNFANKNYFKSRVFELVNLNPQKELRRRRKKAKNATLNDFISDDDHDEKLQCIIMDLSALSYIDPSGITILHAIANEYSSINIPIYLAGCSAPVFESILKCDKYICGEHNFIIFITIHDAVIYAKHKFATR